MSEKLTHNQRKAIGALLEHPTIGAAADAVGVNEKTIRRWMIDPLFRVSLYQVQTVKIDQALMPLVKLAGHAVNALADVMAKPHQRGATNRRLAAQAVIDATLKMRDRTIDQRLTELEVKVYGKE
jgi:hypothetical protein